MNPSRATPCARGAARARPANRSPSAPAGARALLPTLRTSIGRCHSVPSMKALIAAVAVTVLYVAAPADAKRSCGTISVAHEQLPVEIRSGSLTCRTARRAMGRFLPRNGQGNQSFRLARRQWFCADSHGQELTRYGVVAHCVAGSFKVVLLQPLPQPGSTREDPIPLGDIAATGDWRVRVAGTNPNGAADVLAENEFNEPPAPGSQFYIARIEATFTGHRSASFDAGYRLHAVGASAVGYQSGCGVIPDHFPNTEAFAGGTLAGNVCWEVRSTDASSLVMYDDGDVLEETARVFFSLAP